MKRIFLTLCLIIPVINCWSQGKITGNGKYCNSVIAYDELIVEDEEYEKHITLNCMVINDSVDFHQAEFLKPIDFRLAAFYADAYVNNTIFHDTLNFNRAEFRENAYFSKASFREWTDFRYAHFYKKADFRNILSEDTLTFYKAQVDSVAYFNEASFEKSTNFVGTQFHDQVEFTDSQFDHMGLFMGSIFKGDSKFNNVVFRENAVFNGSHFFKNVSFGKSNFKETAYFEKAKFDQSANFSTINFGVKASFVNIAVGDDFILDGSILPDTLHFNFVTDVANQIDFTTAVLADNKSVCYLELVDTDLNNIKLNYENFKLFFSFPDEYTFEQMENTYKNLLAHQKEHGFQNGYKKLTHDYREFRRANGISWFSENTSLVTIMAFLILGIGAIVAWFYFRNKSNLGHQMG